MFHQNSIFEDTWGGDIGSIDKGVKVYLFYHSMLAEQKREAYIYDLGNLMTSLGGNLGLFLGFSCFSTLMFFIKYLFKISWSKACWKSKFCNLTNKAPIVGSPPCHAEE